MINIDTAWQSVLEQMEQKVNRKNFDLWLKSTRPLILSNNTVAVEVSNQFHANWLSKTYSQDICEILSTVCNEQLKVEFIEKKDSEDYIQAVNNSVFSTGSQLSLPPSADIPPLQNQSSLNLTPKYVFDSFVIGDSNNFAHAASLAVAQNPSQAYNPLFIYGASGLGKTHLMHAIGHYIVQHHPNLNLIYISSEKFVNEFIYATSSNTMDKFRQKYRNADVLMIDDIQFFEGKIRTQVEYFHTFNELYFHNKQLVLTSDRPPREIKELEERLISRFEWGLMVDIQPPELETRVAILRKKCEMENYKIPEDITFFIAEKVSGNIRELEGILTRIDAYSRINNVEISFETVGTLLKNILPKDSIKPITINLIQQTVAAYYNMTVKTLLSAKRTRNIVFPRQVSMYLARELTDSSLPQIGKQFGGRDHTTVLHSCDKISKNIEEDSKLAATIAELRKKIAPHA